MKDKKEKTLIDMETLLKKAEEIKKSGGADLSTEEDLSIAIMNLIALEEHFFFTGSKTERPEYFDMLREIREMRKELLARMMDKNEGETWCVSKHLLSATMRLIEVGTKLYGDGREEEGREMFKRAYKTYSMFWAVRLKLVDIPGFKEIARNEAKNKRPLRKDASAGQAWTFEDIVNKLVDCCDE